MIKGEKSMLASVTVWGGILSCLPMIVEVLDKVASTGIFGGQTSVVLSTIGGVLAILGRKRATTTIK